MNTTDSLSKTEPDFQDSICGSAIDFRSARAAVTVVTLFLLNLPNDKIVQLQNAFIIKYPPQ